MANPGTVGGTIADTTLLFGAPDTFGGAGSGVPLFEEGNIFRGVYGVATMLTPAATGSDVVVAAYTIPANAFDVAGRGITVTAIGKFAANTNTKDVKVWFNPATAVVGSTVGAGGSLMGDTGAVTTNGGGWEVGGNAFKRGATGSNTQCVSSNGSMAGAVHGGTIGPLDATAVESAPILVAVTINCTTAATDAGLSFFEINAMN